MDGCLDFVRSESIDKKIDAAFSLATNERLKRSADQAKGTNIPTKLVGMFALKEQKQRGQAFSERLSIIVSTNQTILSIEKERSRLEYLYD
jgi:hypothetical protein